MNKLFKFSGKEIFPVCLIFILAFSRLIPHPPNFTPVIAVAIMSSFFFRNIYLSILVLAISMLLSDIFVGFHKSMIFVYPSLLIINMVFFMVNEKINYKNLFVCSFIGSFMFYIISNFGFWAVEGLYEKNLNGLIQSYFMAIPFFKNTFLSTLIFSYTALLANYFFKKSIN